MSIESAAQSVGWIGVASVALAGFAKLILSLSTSITSRAKSDGDQIMLLMKQVGNLQHRVDELERLVDAKDARIAELERRLSRMGEAGS